MNILPIYPAFPDTFWSFSFALRFIGKKAAFPPLGLITVAALLPATWSLRLVDVNVDDLTDDDLAWADMVFLSAMAVQRKSTAAIIAQCHGKALTIVAGGPFFTAEPEAFGHLDHLVLDEAELTLPAFIADLEYGCTQKIYRANGYPDVHQTPIPLWHLIHMNRYASLNIQYSRGCPFDCDFCNITSLFGSRPRTKTSPQVLAELDAIYQTGWRGNIFFVDDNFIGNKGSLKKQLLPALIEWRKDKKGSVFFTESSINLADDAELMTLMADAGFDSVFIGIESPDEVSLSECRKVHNKNRDMLLDVKKIHRSGMQVMGLDHLIDGYRAIMRQIYSPRKYYQRVRSILKDLKAPTATVPIDWQRFLAFFRACLRLGVLGKERFQYWYLLIWTLARKPRLLPLAVTLSIYGYHYRRICELHIL